MMFGELLRRYVPVTDEQILRLEAHYQLLLAWNRKINLTRVTELQVAVRKHYAESVFLASQLPTDISSVADIGSGAGFPGIPLAVMLPTARVTLVESDQRKAVFLREASADLLNVRVLVKRADDIVERFDAIVSRAVSPDDVAKLTSKLASTAYMLLSLDQGSSTWNQIALLPWDDKSAVMFHVERDAA